MIFCKRTGTLHAIAAAMLLTGAGALLLARPQAAAAGFAHGVALCLHSLLPALFPFFVLCNLFLASPAAALLGRPLRPLVRLWGLDAPDCPLALALSWLGGYAVCARTVAALHTGGRIDSPQAQRLLLLGCCSGPGFVIGCLGGLLLGDARTGLLLYTLQIAANLLAAACLAPFTRSTAAKPSDACPAIATQRHAEGTSLPAAISNAVDSCLQVCGCTVFFCTVAAMLRGFWPPSAPFQAAMEAVWEISSGCAAFAALGGPWALYGLCACLSLPGLSVFCQLAALLGGTVPLRSLAAARLLHFVWLQLLMRLCAHLLPGTVATFSSLGARVIPMTRLPPDAAVLCFIFLVCTLYKLRQRFYYRNSSKH